MATKKTAATKTVLRNNPVRAAEDPTKRAIITFTQDIIVSAAIQPELKTYAVDAVIDGVKYSASGTLEEAA